MKILVTGATGFIGSHLICELLLYLNLQFSNFNEILSGAISISVNVTSLNIFSFQFVLFDISIQFS